MRISYREPSALSGFIAFVGVIACALTAAGFAGAMWWPLDLAAHFRVQYLIVLVVAAVLLGLTRRWRWAGAFTLFAGVNAWMIAPLYVGQRSMVDRDAPVYRAMLIDVEASNDNYSFVRAAVDDADPHIVVLQGLDARWLEALEELEDSHPHTFVRAAGDHRGVAVFSKLRLRDARVVDAGPDSVPTVTAVVGRGESRFVLVAGDSVAPTSRSNAARHEEQLASLAALAQDEEAPMVVLADLNATPWSEPFQRLLEESGLRDASCGRGLQGTWPAGPLPVLLVPLDHCLVSEGITVVDKQVGPDVDSPHYPLVVDFQVR